MEQNTNQVYRYMVRKSTRMKEVIRLRQLQNVVIQDLLLLPYIDAVEPIVIHRFHRFVFTPEGEIRWGDVLNAKVVELNTAAFGLEARLEKANPERVLEFSRLLAGECNNEDFRCCVFDFS